MKCVTSASGGHYYPDHLPLLGNLACYTYFYDIDIVEVAMTFALKIKGAPYKPPGPREFSSGDHVKVELNEEAFTAAMENSQAMDTIMVSGE